MESIVLKERQFVRLASSNRLHVEVCKLVRRTPSGRVDESFSIDRYVRPCTIQTLLDNYGSSVVYSSGDCGREPDVARPERYTAIRDEQQLLAVACPGRRNVQIFRTEVQPRIAVLVVMRHRGLA